LAINLTQGFGDWSQHISNDWKEEFESIECVTTVYNSKDQGVYEQPQKKVINIPLWGPVVISDPPPEAAELWTAVAQAADRALDAKVAEHQECLRTQPESAYEIVQSHGAPRVDSSFKPCGGWGDTTGSVHLERQGFIQGNYDALNQKTCAWSMGDFSCFSGLSVRAFAEVNNGLAATCGTAPVTAVHGKHAGFEADGAVGSVHRGAATVTHDGGLDGWQWEDAIEEARGEGSNDAWKHVDFSDFSVGYGDQGWRYCDDAVHTEYDDCPGGKCPTSKWFKKGKLADEYEGDEGCSDGVCGG
jgi:hypothetical protein